MKLALPTENKTLKRIFQLSIILWLAQILLIIFSWSFLPNRLPLFYSRPWGEEQLGSPWHLFLLPVLGLIVFFVNSILTFSNPQESLINQILTGTILVFNFLSLITLIQIVRLVI